MPAGELQELPDQYAFGLAGRRLTNHEDDGSSPPAGLRVDSKGVACTLPQAPFEATTVFLASEVQHEALTYLFKTGRVGGRKLTVLVASLREGPVGEDGVGQRQRQNIRVGSGKDLWTRGKQVKKPS